MNVNLQPIKTVTMFEQATIHADERRNCATEALGYDLKAAIIEKRIQQLENELIAEIAAENDAAGKPIFSNADKRSAELIRRSAEHGQWLELKSTLDEWKEREAEARINERYHGDLVRIYTAFAGSEAV